MAGSNPTQLCGTGSNRAINILLRRQGLDESWPFIRADSWFEEQTHHCLLASADSQEMCTSTELQAAQPAFVGHCPFMSATLDSVYGEAAMIFYRGFSNVQRIASERLAWPPLYAILCKNRRKSMTCDITKVPGDGGGLEMHQRLRVLAALTEHLGSDPNTHKASSTIQRSSFRDLALLYGLQGH